VPILDSTAAATIEGFVRKAERQGVAIYISGARKPIRHILLAQGVRPPRVRYKPTVEAALDYAHGRLAHDDTEAPHSD
jgi:SulP family sulfate permease